MPKCNDCGKKFSFFSNWNSYPDGSVCGDCDERRKVNRKTDSAQKHEAHNFNSKKLGHKREYRPDDKVRCVISDGLVYTPENRVIGVWIPDVTKAKDPMYVKVALATHADKIDKEYMVWLFLLANKHAYVIEPNQVTNKEDGFVIFDFRILEKEIDPEVIEQEDIHLNGY